MRLRRYHAVLLPVTAFVCDVLPEGQRESTGTELFYEDLDRLPGDELARICEWITEKVDSFTSKLKPEAKDADLEVGAPPLLGAFGRLPCSTQLKRVVCGVRAGSLQYVVSSDWTAPVTFQSDGFLQS